VIAAIYARKSTAQGGVEADATSVARQIDNARTFATAKGWTVIDRHVYADDAVSGAETRRLVNRQRLLDAVGFGTPPFDVLIMCDASRFSRRDGDEAFGELKQLAQRGVAIWFYQDGTKFEHGTFAANITGIVRAEMNAEYRRQVARWTREAMVRKAKAGHVTGGRVFGYDNVCSACGRVIPAGRGRCCRSEGHTEKRINEPQAEVIRRIFALSAAGTGYTRIAKELNAEHAVAPRAQRDRPAAWSPSSVYEVLHRPLYRGEVVWNKTRKRDSEGKTAVSSRPEAEWLRLPRPDLRIVSEDVWHAAQRRLAAARVTYEETTGGRRRPHRDRDSKDLLTGFARCAECGGGFHVRSYTSGRRRAFFYACTSHYNRGPEVCGHGDRWPMEELDRELLATLTEDVLSPDLSDEVVAAARHLFDAATRPDRDDTLRHALAAKEREHARLTEAIATGTECIPVLVDRLRAADFERSELRRQLDRAHTASLPRWGEIERRIRQRLTEVRAALTGDVARARQAFREGLLRTPVQYTPFVDNGYRAIRFEGRWGLDAVFGGELVTNLASPPGFEVLWRVPLAFRVAG
jgi:DNA invertase Pin-like site-specific DNA recombinase